MFRARRLAFLEELGLESADVIAKSDREPAIKAIAHDVGQEKTHGGWIVEASPVGSSQSNGVCGTRDPERARSNEKNGHCFRRQARADDSDGASCDAIDRRERCASRKPMRRGQERQDGLRTQQKRRSEGRRTGVRRACLVAQEAGRWTPC